MVLQIQPDWEVHPTEVKQRLDAAAPLLLIDVRPLAEWNAAHIAAARLIPLDQIEKQLPTLEAWKDKPVVLHCHHGVRSLQAARLLRARGFQNVRSMAGGIDAWSLLVDPAVKRY